MILLRAGHRVVSRMSHAAGNDHSVRKPAYRQCKNRMCGGPTRLARTEGVAGVPKKFDVAVVGGGVIGLAAAVELRRVGVPDVVVLESEPAVGRGSSTRANGGVRAQFTTAVNIDFSLYSIAEFERMHRGGELPSWHQTGYLFVTGRPEAEAGLRRALELQRAMGVGSSTPTNWWPLWPGRRALQESRSERLQESHRFATRPTVPCGSLRLAARSQPIGS